MTKYRKYKKDTINDYVYIGKYHNSQNDLWHVI